jgi:hypothetical protein
MLNNYSITVNKQLQDYDSTLFDSKHFNKFRSMKNSVDFDRMCNYLECD